jgi:lipopolysaccharide transport system permease protein
LNTSATKAFSDLYKGLSMSGVWWGLAWQEIKQRYSRSVIGPFWITLSAAVMVAAMGPLYGALLGQSVSSYIQHLAISFIIWTFISATINEAGTVFVGAEGYIKQVALPLSVYVLKLISKNLLMLAHNCLVIVVVLCILPPGNFNSMWMVPFGVLLVVCNLCWLVLFLGILSARYRDIPQLVTNVVQVAFFLSPIIWSAEMLPQNRRFLADFNPLFHFIEVIRAPLLGESIRSISWLVLTAMMVCGSILTFLIFKKFRPRIPYWL